MVATVAATVEEVGTEGRRLARLEDKKEQVGTVEEGRELGNVEVEARVEEASGVVDWAAEAKVAVVVVEVALATEGTGVATAEGVGTEERRRAGQVAPTVAGVKVAVVQVAVAEAGLEEAVTVTAALGVAVRAQEREVAGVQEAGGQARGVLVVALMVVAFPAEVAIATVVMVALTAVEVDAAAPSAVGQVARLVGAARAVEETETERVGIEVAEAMAAGGSEVGVQAEVDSGVAA